jgi:MFS family permease
MSRLRDASCYILAGWSGFFVMVVELLSGRLIAPYFGNSIYVWGSVIFVFMLGLAIGYLLGGLYSSRAPSLPKLCLLLALAAVVTLPCILFAEPLLGTLFDQVEDPRYGSLLACFALFFLPAVASGTISPYAVRILVRDAGSSGRRAGYLYFVSTVGSSAGTLLTSFFLVLWFEVNIILAGAMAISLALAAAMALIHRGDAAGEATGDAG